MAAEMVWCMQSLVLMKALVDAQARSITGETICFGI